jgi:hypothetical protein
MHESSNYCDIHACQLKVAQRPTNLRSASVGRSSHAPPIHVGTLQPYSQLAHATAVALAVAFLCFAVLLAVISLDYLQMYLRAGRCV